MLIKLIACDVFTREVCHCVARSPQVVDLEFTPKGAHDDPDRLRALIQEKIDAACAADKAYDAICLLLGLCGNATVGLTSRGPKLVIPRAHDCCTLFLGSREKFKEVFGHRPSTPFSSVGYVEHGGDLVRQADCVRKMMGLDKPYEDYVKEYGEESAKHIWETLCPDKPAHEEDSVVFIEIPGFGDSPYAEQCREKAEADGKQFEKIEGSMALIEKLVFGNWSEEDFLVVQQGEAIAGVYDLDEVLKAGS